MKQLHHQLKQKQEQKAALFRQLEVINKEEEQLQQAMQFLTNQFQPAQPVKEENPKAADSSTSKETDSSVEEITPKSTSLDPQNFPPIHAANTESKKWYVLFNGPHKGIYNDWGIANSHIVGKNVTHKSYKTKAEAEAAYKEAYKTITIENTLQKSSKTVSLGTPIKQSSIPRSLNQLNAKAALDEIPSTKAKELMKKPSTEKFAKIWDSLVSYTEIHELMGFYPVIRRPGPKAVFLAHLSDPMTIWEYFIHGFIDTIYIDGPHLQCINEFPSSVQTIIRNYKTRFAKDRNIYIKLYSSYPFFDEESQLLVPSITFAHLGISNGTKPTKDELLHETPSPEHLIFGLAGVYIASSRIGKAKDQRSDARINYCSKTFVIYTTIDSEISTEGIKALEMFEEQFEKFTGHLAELPSDIKRQLCKHINTSPRHSCNYCKENVEDTPFMEALSDE